MRAAADNSVDDTVESLVQFFHDARVPIHQTDVMVLWTTLRQVAGDAKPAEAEETLALMLATCDAHWIALEAALTRAFLRFERTKDGKAPRRQCISYHELAERLSCLSTDR